jgi:hypothetical protein
MIVTKKIDDMIITYRDDKETRDAVFEKIIAWYIKQGCFIGEALIQNDYACMDAPMVLSDIADDIIEFGVDYEEEDE